MKSTVFCNGVLGSLFRVEVGLAAGTVQHVHVSRRGTTA